MPRQMDAELMARSVARVLDGEKATAVSADAKIPYSTLMRYVARGRRRAEPRSAAASPSPAQANAPSTPLLAPAAAPSAPAAAPFTVEAEQEVIEWMASQQAAGRRLNRQNVLAKADEVLNSRYGATTAAWWFRRFRHRHPEVVGSSTKLSVAQVTGQASAGEKEAALCGHCAVAGSALSAVERAVDTLQREYTSTLEPERMAAAFDVMVDPLLAQAFLAMSPGDARDLWLNKQLRRTRDGAGEM